MPLLPALLVAAVGLSAAPWAFTSESVVGWVPFCSLLQPAIINRNRAKAPQEPIRFIIFVIFLQTVLQVFSGKRG